MNEKDSIYYNVSDRYVCKIKIEDLSRNPV